MPEINEFLPEPLKAKNNSTNTLGGYILEALGHVPSHGEQLQTSVGYFIVLATRHRRLLELLYIRSQEDAG